MPDTDCWSCEEGKTESDTPASNRLVVPSPGRPPAADHASRERTRFVAASLTRRGRPSPLAAASARHAPTGPAPDVVRLGRLGGGSLLEAMRWRFSTSTH
jgi:hypothetical protein